MSPKSLERKKSSPKTTTEQFEQRWVKLNRYCELTGDTPDAVHAKRKKGIWLDGVQCRLAPDRKIWVNLPAVNQWVAGSCGGAL